MKLATVLNGGWRWLAARTTGRPLLSSVTFFPTLRCNCSCAYCDFPRGAGTELDLPAIRALLTALRRHGTARLGVSGGEPLLRKDFGAIARAVQDEGFLSSLVTNGVLLERWLDAAARFDFVLCTAEGDPATHDRVRGPGVWAAALAGMEALRRRGHRRLGVICPVHAGNVDAIEETLRVAESLGARAFFQPAQVRQGWRGAPFTETLSREPLADAFRRVAAWKRAGRPVGNSLLSLRLVTDGHVDGFPEGCAAGRFFFTILPDATVLPCCMVDWADAGRPLDLDDPARTVREMAGTSRTCGGCTILPYVENSFLLRPSPAALLDSLRW